MAESAPLENLKYGKTSNHFRYFKMKVLKSHMSAEIELIKNSLNLNAIVTSHKSTSYIHFEKYVEAHIAEKSKKKTTIVMLKWEHTTSNVTRNFLGVYYEINGQHLQNYLDEFVYKLNRRWFKSIFERLGAAFDYPYWQTNE